MWSRRGIADVSPGPTLLYSMQIQWPGTSKLCEGVKGCNALAQTNGSSKPQRPQEGALWHQRGTMRGVRSVFDVQAARTICSKANPDEGQTEGRAGLLSAPFKDHSRYPVCKGHDLRSRSLTTTADTPWSILWCAKVTHLSASKSTWFVTGHQKHFGLTMVEHTLQQHSKTTVNQWAYTKI